MNKAIKDRLKILIGLVAGLMAADCGGNSHPASPVGTGGAQAVGKIPPTLAFALAGDEGAAAPKTSRGETSAAAERRTWRERIL